MAELHMGPDYTTPLHLCTASSPMLCSALPMHGWVGMYIQEHPLELEKWGPPAADPLPKMGANKFSDDIDIPAHHIQILIVHDDNIQDKIGPQNWQIM